MANIQGAQQAPIITQRYLDTAAYLGDPAPGAIVGNANVSGSLIESYGGFVGGRMFLSAAEAAYYSDPLLALFGGVYQYVQIRTAAAADAVQGQMLFWFDIVNGIVTPDVTAANVSLKAGVALGNTKRGNYWFMQVDGVAQLKFRAALTKAAPAIGDLVVMDSTPGIFGDVQLDATALTSPLVKLAVGRAWATAPANATITPVMLGITPSLVMM